MVSDSITTTNTDTDSESYAHFEDVDRDVPLSTGWRGVYRALEVQA